METLRAWVQHRRHHLHVRVVWASAVKFHPMHSLKVVMVALSLSTTRNSRRSTSRASFNHGRFRQASLLLCFTPSVLVAAADVVPHQHQVAAADTPPGHMQSQMDKCSRSLSVKVELGRAPQMLPSAPTPRKDEMRASVVEHQVKERQRMDLRSAPVVDEARFVSRVTLMTC